MRIRQKCLYCKYFVKYNVTISINNINEIIANDDEDDDKVNIVFKFCNYIYIFIYC